MKFDVALGNPPYHKEAKGTRKTKVPFYHLFMQLGRKVSLKTILIIPARFLFRAGNTPTDFNEKMLFDLHFKVVSYVKDSSIIFPNVQIKAGVVITLINKAERYSPIGIFIPFKELDSIYRKVKPFLNHNMSQLFVESSKLDLKKLYHDYPETKKVISSQGKERRLQSNIFSRLPIFTQTAINQKQLKVYGVVKNKRAYRFVDAKYIKQIDSFKKYRLLIPKASGTGDYGERLADLIICGPNQIATYTFTSIGCFDTKQEAINAQRYLKTKFARSLLGILKVTQDTPSNKWKCIPIQDFTGYSDIDWSKSIKDIDKQLYVKYKLNNKEIAFIESHVRAMD